MAKSIFVLKVLLPSKKPNFLMFIISKNLLISGLQMNRELWRKTKQIDIKYKILKK